MTQQWHLLYVKKCSHKKNEGTNKSQRSFSQSVYFLTSCDSRNLLFDRVKSNHDTCKYNKNETRHLFYQNKKLEYFNQKVIIASHEEKLSIIASDFVTSAQAKQREKTLLGRTSNDCSKIIQLASELCIAAINLRSGIVVNTR